MDIYIKSSGVSSDYYWQKAEKASIIKKEPEIPQEILSLIDSDYPSLVLFRQNSKLLLLVTAFDTKKRTDNRMRKIRNSIVWIGDDDSKTEKILRSLVIRYCNEVNSLASSMDEAVTNAKDGFSVDYSKLPSLEPDKNLGNKLPDLTLKILKIGNLENLREKLVEELQKSQIPADKEGFLIVLSEVNSKKSFQSAQVWRGLSKQIQSDDDKWEDIENETARFRGKTRASEMDKKFNPKFQFTPLKVICVFSIILNIVLGWQTVQFWNYKNNLNNQIKKLQNEIQELKTQKTNLKSDVDELNDQKSILVKEMEKEIDDFKESINDQVKIIFQNMDNLKADFKSRKVQS